MWKDDNGILQDSLINVILHGKPLVVDCCDSPMPHYYFCRSDDKKGSAWAWCSNCKSFVHLDFIPVPDNWADAEEIKLSDLYAIPKVLEKKKEIVDKQFKKCFYAEFRSA